MAHRKTQNTIGNFMSIRQIFWCRTLQTTICAEFRNQRIEVSTTKYILFFHFEVELITSNTIFFGINKDGKVRIIVSYSCNIVKKKGPLTSTKSFLYWLSTICLASIALSKSLKLSNPYAKRISSILLLISGATPIVF